MFSGFTNQMSSISSWIGAKKAGAPSEETSPQNPEEPVVAEAVASSPVTSGVDGGTLEPEQPKGDLFSSMKNQMSSWLSKKENSDQLEEPKEPHTDEPVIVEAETTNPEEEAGENEGEKEGFGSGLEEVSKKTMQGARTIGSFFASAVSKAGKTVTEAGAKIKKTVEETTILSEFNKEQEAFIKSKNKIEGSIPPWVGYPEEEALKAEILSLSTDRRNFVRSPPAGVQFQFDYDSFYPIALATLAEDPNLETMRFELVPKIIKEELFWRNYFYRVSLLRQSTELSSMTQGEGNRDSANHSRESSFDEDDKTEGADTPDSPTNEFVSDSYQSNTLSKDLKEVQEGIKRLGSKKPNDEEWEKELQAELQDYELGSEGSGQTGGADADDIEEMLDAEESHGDLK
ncbi:Synapse-associated protein 1 [Daphnia magna]|uniref:Synapse-associated protein 1 n=1 Tax=Daphnia magna TaxID=35525 RepID=A0A164Y1I4_9CRUS|nr:Synapse-associated protein 1 [Daphnia magna]